MLPDAVRGELHLLLGNLTEGLLQGEERARLSEILRTSAEARELYGTSIEIHSLLEWIYSPTPPSLTGEFASKDAAIPASSPAENRRVGRGFKDRLPWWAAGAACLSLAALLFLLSRSSERSPTPEPASFVAQVISEQKANWGPESTTRPGTKLLAGQTLDLVDGMAALKFGNGADVVIHAPARIEVQSVREVSLEYGRLAATVPAKSNGFVVKASTNLTTTNTNEAAEFGMQVAADGVVEVHMFVGTANADVSENGAGASSIPLKAQDAVLVSSAGVVRRGAAVPARFARSVAPAEMTEVAIRAWRVLGPLGHPLLKDRPAEWRVPPVGAKEIRNYNFVFGLFAHDFGSGLYPMDPMLRKPRSEIDLSAKYSGTLTQDASGRQPEVAWTRWIAEEKKPAFPEFDRLEKGAGLAYFSTWIHVPDATDAEISFRGYGKQPRDPARLGVLVAAWINGIPLRAYRIQPDNPMVTHPVDDQTIELKAGWNHLYCRHASAWEGIRNDVRLRVAADVATTLKISADPPDDVGPRFSPTGKKIIP